MHPSLCSIVSDLVYDGCLQAHPSTAQRTLIFRDAEDSPGDSPEQFQDKDDRENFSDLKEISGRTGPRLVTQGAGVVVVALQHEGNTQASDEEAALVQELVQELLDPSRVGLRTGSMDPEKLVQSRPLTWQDLLFVTPFNMQVRRLADALGPEARIGTVDRFQGQEAPVVVVSLCRSSFDDMEGLEPETANPSLDSRNSQGRSLTCPFWHLTRTGPQSSLTLTRSL